jgi:hypothetical protein
VAHTGEVHTAEATAARIVAELRSEEVAVFAAEQPEAGADAVKFQLES